MKYFDLLSPHCDRARRYRDIHGRARYRCAHRVSCAFGRAFLLCVLLAGCAAEPQLVRVPFEVKVPVPVRAEPPAALTARLITPRVTWRLPTATGVTSALDSEGEKALKRAIVLLMSRVRAWEAWATEQEEPADVR